MWIVVVAISLAQTMAVPAIEDGTVPVRYGKIGVVSESSVSSLQNLGAQAAVRCSDPRDLIHLKWT